MRRRIIGFHSELMAKFARLMQMKRPPDYEAFKVKVPVDPFPVEDVQDQEDDNAEADHQ
jgi:hypothetical protein